MLDRYQFAGAHMKNQRGYRVLRQDERSWRSTAMKAIEFFADLQVYGTPEQVFSKIMTIHRQTNNSGYVGVFSYAGMPHWEAARNVRLFASTVYPNQGVRRRRHNRPRPRPARSALRRRGGGGLPLSARHNTRAPSSRAPSSCSFSHAPLSHSGEVDEGYSGETAPSPPH